MSTFLARQRAAKIRELQFYAPRSRNNNNNKSHSTKRRRRNTSNSLTVQDGPPEFNITEPKQGQIYIDEKSLDIYLYASELGWIQVNGWYPDVGEGPPGDENPPSPENGDTYLDVLTADFYYFTEGFGWVLLTGKEGPPGPPGPGGYSEVFYAQIDPSSKHTLTGKEHIISFWNIPDFQDPDYNFDKTLGTLNISNKRDNSVRYQVNFQITLQSTVPPPQNENTKLNLHLIKDGHVYTSGGCVSTLLTNSNYQTLSCQSTIIEVAEKSESNLRLRITLDGDNADQHLIKLIEGSITVIRLG